MKKLLFVLMIMGIAACQKENVSPQPDVFAGTTWVSYQFGIPPDKSVYKVLEFREDGHLNIDYQIDLSRVYFPVGLFVYQKQSETFWVLNPAGGRIDGSLKNDKVIFGGEVFERR